MIFGIQTFLISNRSETEIIFEFYYFSNQTHKVMLQLFTLNPIRILQCTCLNNFQTLTMLIASYVWLNKSFFTLFMHLFISFEKSEQIVMFTYNKLLCLSGFFITSIAICFHCLW